ncbi:MAG TPA: hypothetical protein VEQ63_12875 [Bryobacteraceae bacterium]|nr:hypothetical protein [Bryobacteraceae bacterium]
MTRRAAVACFTATVILSFVLVSLATACPFLLSSAEHSAPCCPRQSTNGKCPLSKNVQTCPYYVTESKLGITKSAVQTVLLHADFETNSPIPVLHVPVPSQQQADIFLEDGSRSYLRNGVLLI